jgi:hypothetical protein
VNGYVCGSRRMPDDVPDAGEGLCCPGAWKDGPTGCTCWEPEHDLAQAEPVTGPANARAEMCLDCAYRPASPERRGDPEMAGDEAGLMALVRAGQPFACHQGMRRRRAWSHPAGATYAGHPGDYDPPVRGGVAYRTDGTPADVCAGWLALRLKALAAS